MDQYLLPGYYNLISATISQYGNPVSQDISELIHKIVIEESIENDSVRGYLSIIDAVGFLEKLPLRGEERLILEIEDITKQKKIFDFYVYKVDGISAKNTNDALSYNMHFVSYMRWTAGRRKIIASYSRSIRDTAQQIFDEYYKPNTKPYTKPFKTDATEGNFKCIIPNYTPVQALKFLASRAYNDFSPSCSFRFFENSENFYFVPDEYLIADAIATNNIKQFTFLPAIDKSGMDIESQLKNLIELTNTDRINTIKDMHSGAYQNNPIVIDFVNKTVTNNRYSYQENKNEFIKVDQKATEVEDLHSNNYIDYMFTEENERRFLIYKDYQSQGDPSSTIRDEQFLPKIISRRTTYRHMLYRNTVYAKAYGRLDLKAGDIIKLVVKEFSMTGDQSGGDSQLSGNYILHDCTHIFDKDLYETTMMLTKFDWSKAE